jgi:hypothetical protein
MINKSQIMFDIVYSSGTVRTLLYYSYIMVQKVCSKGHLMFYSSTNIKEHAQHS